MASLFNYFSLCLPVKVYVKDLFTFMIVN